MSKEEIIYQVYSCTKCKATDLPKYDMHCVIEDGSWLSDAQKERCADLPSPFNMKSPGNKLVTEYCNSCARKELVAT